MITINTEKAEAQRKSAIAAQIAQLETESLMNRGSREFQMRAMEKEAAEQSEALAAQGVAKSAEEILQEVPAYVKFKELDDQVSALRAQL